MTAHRMAAVDDVQRVPVVHRAEGADEGVRVNQPAFGHVGDAGAGDPMRRPTGDVFAVEQDPPRARRDETHDGAHRRGFADPVAAENRRDRAIRQFEIHALQNVAGAVMGIETFDREHQANPPR